MLCVDIIFKMAAAVILLSVLLSVCFGKIIDVTWDKMHFTWLPRRDGHQILPSPLYARLWAGYGELVGEHSISAGKTM